MSTLYLIRHGQASFGEKNYDRLSDIGHRQAKILGEHLLLFGQSFDAIYHGRLDRQRQTAENVMACYEKSGRKMARPAVSEAFDEYNAFAVWKAYMPRLIKEEPSLESEMEQIRADPKAFQKIFGRIMFRWISGKYDRDGEPRWADFKSRVTDGLYALMERHGSGSRIAVFTSGGPISVMVQRALDLSDEKTMELSWQVMNASVTRMKYRDGNIALAGFNDISHLRMAGNETLLTYR
ncbi:phosphoglycerate mutase [Desulfonema ishimotonii]|uniref:Phosphoglycerate mutase n=1 Tax=Desulfonema ishimotonii TaxID=45657 RepID=A0A401FQE1_9BACT|nr:histidine phosphatase family protein [Desulfonema ishimotonii]GBC59209.1 phosphoglycerate mutase [Desulfonema ishimotonii]